VEPGAEIAEQSDTGRSLRRLIMDAIEIETDVSRRHRAKLAKRKDLFVMLPYPAILKLAAALNNAEMAVVTYLVHETWRLRTDTVPLLSFPFREAGFQRNAKTRALRRLEKIGAAQVIRHGKHTPKVKLAFSKWNTVHPKRG
jgi:hypothetical protein